jgi:hypothetical protein
MEAGPAPRFGAFDQRCTQRITFYVSADPQKMTVVAHGNCFEAALGTLHLDRPTLAERSVQQWIPVFVAARFTVSRATSMPFVVLADGMSSKNDPRPH